MDSSALWVFERLDGSWGGAGVKSTGGNSYRIRSLTSGLCLCEVQDGEITVTNEYVQSGCEWLFKPFQSGRVDIFVGSLSQFVNCKTGRFLSLSESDSALDVSTSALGSDRDALTITRPDAETLKILDTVKDFSFRLSNIIGRMRKEFSASGDLTKALTPESKLMKTVFTDMTITCSKGDELDPMKRDGPPMVAWQDTYGEQKVIDQVVELVKQILGCEKDAQGEGWEISIDDIQQGMYGECTFEALKILIRFLRAVVKRHTPNQKRLAQYLGWFQDSTQLRMPLPIVDTVAAVYDCNRELLEQVKDETIVELVDLLVDLHSGDLMAARFVDLLRMLCICDGAPIPSNQNKICQYFLKREVLQCSVSYKTASCQSNGAPAVKKKKKKSKKDTMAEIESAPAPAATVVPHIALPAIDRPKWVPLTLFCGKTAAILKKNLGDCDDNERTYRYHIQSMRLFVAACLGRNRMCTDHLLLQADTLGLRYPDMWNTLQDSELPPTYRGLVADVIVALYIDREPNESINPINRIRIWQEVNPAKEDRAQKVKVDPFKNFPDFRPPPGFPDIRAYLLRFYTGTKGQFSQDINMNVLITTMIRISFTLLDFGFYHNDEGQADLPALSLLIDPLLDLLDGRNDGPDPSRFQFSDTTAPIWDARLNICKIIEFIFDCRVDKRLEMAYETYEKALDRGFAAGRLHNYLGDADQVAADMSLSPVPWTAADLAELNENLFNRPLISKRVAMSKDLLNPPDFVKILLDCTLLDTVPLCVNAFSLLNRHYGQRSAMVKVMQSMQVVVFDDVAVLRYELAVAVSEVRRNLKWLMSISDEDRIKGFACVHHIFDRCIQLCTLHESVIIVDGRPTQITAAEVAKFQAMLLNLGMHTKILSIMAMPFTVDNTDGMGLLQKCYDLFRVMAHLNPRNQEELYKHLSLFFRHMSLGPLTSKVADALSSTIIDNKTIHHTDHHVCHKIMSPKAQS